MKRAAVTAALIALVAGSVVGSAPSARSTAPLPVAPAEKSVSVPDVVGLGQGEAVKALGAAGLVANVRFDRDAPRTGKVLRSVPEAGSELASSSIVALTTAWPPRLPTPEPDDEQPPEALSSLIQNNPDAFFGTYRDDAGVMVAVFGPGVDPAAWQDRLRAAANGSALRTDTCPRDRERLEAAQDWIPKNVWRKGLSFGVWVDAETCTVRVDNGTLGPVDLRALAERYGTALSIETMGGAFRLVGR